MADNRGSFSNPPRFIPFMGSGPMEPLRGGTPLINFNEEWD